MGVERGHDDHECGGYDRFEKAEEEALGVKSLMGRDKSCAHAAESPEDDNSTDDPAKMEPLECVGQRHESGQHAEVENAASP